MVAITKSNAAAETNNRISAALSRWGAIVSYLFKRLDVIDWAVGIELANRFDDLRRQLSGDAPARTRMVDGASPCVSG